MCTRHRERHTARGSHLQRKDPYGQNSDSRIAISSPIACYSDQPSNIFQAALNGQPATNGNLPGTTVAPTISSLTVPVKPVHSPISSPVAEPQQQHATQRVSAGSRIKSPHLYHARATSEYSIMASLNRSHSDEQFYAEPLATEYDASKVERVIDSANYDSTPGHPSLGSYNNVRAQNATLDGLLSRSTTQPFSNSANYQHSPNSAYAGHTPQNNISQPDAQNSVELESCIPHQSYLPRPPLPPPSIYAFPQPTSRAAHFGCTSTSTPQTPIETNSSFEMQNSNGMDPNMIDPNGNLCSNPVFGGNGYGLSPNAMADDFAAWLFSAPHISNAAPGDLRHCAMSIGQTAFTDDSGNLPHIPYGVDGGSVDGHHLQPTPSQHRMAVNSILDPIVPPTILSAKKRKELLDLIDLRFNETDHAPVRKQKQDLLGGDRDADGHVLSLKMMETYIGSYWYHFHPQMPILHQPTFLPDEVENLLLIAVITVGASCLDKLHGSAITKAGAALSNFLAWHLRGEIFKDVDFTPPAKLWVFQSLLLLEIYEKMYSTRILHERAHIHHGTTLTLMRRGSSLIGRSALDPLPLSIDEKSVNPLGGGQRTSTLITPEQWWNHWITNEATRRVAFAAFIIDSIHATMFGHSATMVAHEMKLQLPCDESAWSANSSAEVNRIEMNLHASGIRPITFFDGLKLTLNHKPVRTNPFGRIALMAGLLSVSWHMNQRDVQVRSLGALKALGGKDIWRGTLTKAFDSWWKDFDHNIGKDSNPTSLIYHTPNKFIEDIIFESRTVLHHLAHMAMHVDIVSCQIFAKASRLLGRTTLPSDYTIAQKRIKENWAPKASARHATFYALKFLALVLTPDATSSLQSQGVSDIAEYAAKDDFLLNRPWVLYFAALTVWSYGYALDGPVRVVPELSTVEQQVCDMRVFLVRVGGVRSPGDLENTRDRNACLGMLFVLRDMFDKCRWELVHEAVNLLTNCIDMVKGVC